MESYMKILSHTPLFAGLDAGEISQLISCVTAERRSFPRHSYIFRAGDVVSSMGLVLRGSVLLVQEDLWGRRNIIAKLQPGEIFAETFAASVDVPLNLSILANEDCEILFLNMSRILTVCPTSCPHHVRVMKNLVSVLAKKVLAFNDKVTHMSRKTTREKLISYLSTESQRQNSLEFDISYDRQQLADFLCVERAAMSVELSKLQKQGIIEYNKNHFRLSVDADVEL